MVIYQQENSRSQAHVKIDLYTDFHYVPHLHRDLEFALMLEGEMEITVQGRTEIMRPGDLALVLSNEVHAYRTESHSKVLVCPFSGDFVHAFQREMEGKAGQSSVFPCPGPLQEYLKSCFLQQVPPDLMTLKAAFYAICARYLQAVPLRPVREGHDELLHKLLQYVKENYRENITMKTAARAIGYDANYLSRYFHQMVGMNFRRFIHQYRIEYACSLLEEPGFSIADVALLSGFQNIRSFNRAFQEIMQKTPSEYRQ